MDTRTRTISHFLILLVAIILISIPICILLNMKADADETTQTVQEYDNDYVFFVLEDSKVPLAAAPISHSSHTNMTFAFVSFAFISVFAFGYLLWYLSIKHTTAMLVSVSPIMLRKDLIERNSILHPIRSYRASKEAEYSVTQKYFFFS